MPPDRVRRRPACRECRVQKVKCDTEPPNPCTRCRRMQLECVIVPTPASRRTKAQLQRELEDFRRRAERLYPDEDNDSRSNSPTRLSGVEVDGASASVPFLVADPVPGPLLVPALTPASEEIATSLQPQTSPSISKTSNNRQSSISQSQSIESPTSSQVFDGQDVAGRKIQDCFNLFFSLYAPFLPIFNNAIISPNQCFAQSPFLSWMIVYIGSRHYAGDPTLLERLAPRINSMAFAALEKRNNPIQTIQGILLLCQWPTPIDTMHRGISLVLAGAALHLAMVVGLHITGVGQDFARTILNRNRCDRDNRRMLWRQCCTTSYIIGLSEGIMPLGLNDALTLPVQSEGDDGNSGCELDSPQEAKGYLKLCEIMICATEALKRAHSGTDSKSSSSLLSCISLFDTQLTKAALQLQTTIDSIYYQCYRLYLLAYHFLVDAAFRKPEGFISLYAVACNLVNMVCQRSEEEESIAKIAPAFVQKTIVLAACTILKIHRSDLAPHLDLEAGEQAYFASIVFAREGSIQNNDLSARGATIFSQLWNSQNIFKGKDGRIDSLSSRISSRLSTSIVFDCLWWWRQEFGGSGNPYENKRQTQVTSLMGNNNGISLEQRTADEAAGDANAALDAPQTATLADEPFVDFDWDMGLNLNEWPL
ncbi:hypothetical protein M441DRAFT_62116 [Trichoderma asperellum CBS 433.97]|uniref:Zn(2)-C6 fungal-type domain-containing protein n=1 Tax=Trichoderma asperellum (strain ATCC 204424 / CBS 433.97 / NBRC 101777) TaxID=1042311 RepID=A0A2T3YVR5_TRIA4|nr:hypothetical protein M441DRAFT_62116 [Trichoderma asperellum CBS 433.97]PTB36661.1 hypothetical protein M441DRAFT_62116 [Trichoderma asperellum CBS 433.97]